MKYLLLVIAFSISGHVHADESVRQAKISQIIEAQGLHQIFQDQIDQSKAAASDLGRSLYRKMLSENGAAEGKGNPKFERVFAQYIERSAAMFAANEFIEIWSRFYGGDLSESELDEILAYYRSSVGKKDVSSTRAAMVGFSSVMNAEIKKRTTDLMVQLVADLKAVMEITNPAAHSDAAR